MRIFMSTGNKQKRPVNFKWDHAEKHRRIDKKCDGIAD